MITFQGMKESIIPGLQGKVVLKLDRIKNKWEASLILKGFQRESQKRGFQITQVVQVWTKNKAA